MTAFPGSAPGICSFCVMETGEGGYEVDASGRCVCCRAALARQPHEWFPGPDGERKLNQLVEVLRRDGKDKAYDALVGLSGGIDSAYLAHMLRTRFNLRLLVLHVDGGWNTSIAVSNIESLVRTLDLDLLTYVVEWEEMRDLQLAFLRASVLNQDIPQDHAFFISLYRTAQKFQIRHFLSGVNFSSENIEPPDSGHPWSDGKHLRAVHQRFGEGVLRTFPVMSFTRFLWTTRIRRVLNVHRPLNLLPYDKVAAQGELQRNYDWQDYGGKHHESRWTRFYQEVYLPAKTNFDKRRLHLSSLIVSGQCSREQALAELDRPIATAESKAWQTKFIAKKLRIPQEEMRRLMQMPLVPHTDYPHSHWPREFALALRAAQRAGSSLLRQRDTPRVADSTSR